MAKKYKKQTPFSDYKTAERLWELVDYSTDKKIKKARYDRHYRATIQSINNDRATIRLADSSVDIDNVKIRDGLDVKAGDDIYILALNNNLNKIIIDFKVDQFELMFDLYDKKEYKEIDRFQNNSDWTSGAGTQSDDLIYYKVGNQALKIAEDDNTGSLLYSTNTLSSPIDLTQFDDGTDSSLGDKIFVSFRINNLSSIDTSTGINLRFVTSLGNYFDVDINTGLTAGWNNVSVEKGDFSETGTGDWSDINEIRLAWLSNNNYSGEYVNFGALYLIQNAAKINGELVLNDPVWEDLRVPLTQTRQGALAKPDFDTTNVGFLFPQNDTSEVLYTIVQMPHSWKEGTNINPHVHYRQTSSSAPTFTIEYKWINIGGTIPAGFTSLNLDQPKITYVSGSIHQINAPSAMIDGTGKTLSSLLLIKLYRNDNIVTGDVLTWEFDLHYEIDTLGSRTEFIK